jgi:hypothetical protein
MACTQAWTGLWVLLTVKAAHPSCICAFENELSQSALSAAPCLAMPLQCACACNGPGYMADCCRFR